MVYKNGYVGMLGGQGQADTAPKGVSFQCWPWRTLMEGGPVLKQVKMTRLQLNS